MICVSQRMKIVAQRSQRHETKQHQQVYQLALTYGSAGFASVHDEIFAAGMIEGKQVLFATRTSTMDRLSIHVNTGELDFINV